MKKPTNYAAANRMNLLPLLAVLIIACGGDDPVEPEPDPSIAGEWTAQVADAMLALTLTESASGVGGSASVSIQGFTIQGPVSGTYQYPNVMLAWLLPGAMGTDCQFSGRMDEDGDHIEGDLACTGEAPIQSEIVLHRRG